MLNNLKQGVPETEIETGTGTSPEDVKAALTVGDTKNQGLYGCL